MIIVYTGDKTYIKKNADSAKDVIYEVYGEKIGQKAYETISDNLPGTVFRYAGGPRIDVVTEEQAEIIEAKEREIGALVE